MRLDFPLLQRERPRGCVFRIDMNPVYRNAKFILSVMSMAQLPEGSRYEVVFAGCSNAGKSSVINTLTNQKKLAKVSKTPGRTQSLNFFQIDDCRYIVDLPGYGYSTVSSQTKAKWEKLLDSYFTERECLEGVVLVMDIRHPLKKYDIQLLEWCAYNKLSSHLVLTKSDKLKRGPARGVAQKVAGWLKEKELHATVQSFSSLKRDGVDELHSVLDGWFGFSSPSLGREDRDEGAA